MIQILDSTLREGEQHPSVCFTANQKLLIARKLDELGVDFIEAGNPAVHSANFEAVREIACAGLRATIVAHSLCRDQDVEQALETGADLIGLFLNISPHRLKHDLGLELSEALKRINAIIKRVKKKRPDVRVRFTVEDAFRCPTDMLLTTLITAAQAGVDLVSLADTTGFVNPFLGGRTFGNMVLRVRESMEKAGLKPLLEVHCHNDRGLALANALDACRSGVDIVDASVLGLGERAGIVDLATLLLNLVEHFELVNRWNLSLLPELYAMVSEFAGFPIPSNHPVTGKYSFTHTAGVHIKAMIQDGLTYQSLTPNVFGRTWDYSLGPQSGSTTVRLALQGIGREDLSCDPIFVSALLNHIKSFAQQKKAINLKDDFVQIVHQMEAGGGDNTSLREPADSRYMRNAPIRPERSPGFKAFPLEGIHRTITDRFDEQVTENGHSIAVVDHAETLSYDALNNRANQICCHILALRGPGSEAVGLLLGHEADTVAVILAVLKAGKYYIPLDPTHPPARLASILRDTGAALLISKPEFEVTIASISAPEMQCINIAELSGFETTSPDCKPDDASLPAYIIYTSGSTGRPKGVVQTHRTVLHNVFNYTNSICISPDDRLSLLAAFSFSASISAIFGALLNGASLYLYDMRKWGVDNLPQWLQEKQITVYHSVPTIFRQLLHGLSGKESFSSLRLIKLGGESVSRYDFELYRRHFPDTCIFHVGFGASEKNIICQYFADKFHKMKGPAIPVGYPAEGVEIQILDESGRPLQENEVGEIAVRSCYLSTGYWQQPELSQSVFQPDPVDPAYRIFKTGDMGYRMPDGCIVHLGRKDYQVKIRGQRVEPAEIELALRNIKAVKDVVIVTIPDAQGEIRLVAYIVTHKEVFISARELRSRLELILPLYMVPARFAFLESLPMTGSGKIDRKALPDPDDLSIESRSSRSLPADDMERDVANIWKEVLAIETIGVEDNFFELGGQSLQATRILNRILKKFGIKISLRDFFQVSTISALAQTIQERQTDDVRVVKASLHKDKKPDRHPPYGPSRP